MPILRNSFPPGPRDPPWVAQSQGHLLNLSKDSLSSPDEATGDALLLSPQALSSSCSPQHGVKSIYPYGQSYFLPSKKPWGPQFNTRPQTQKTHMLCIQIWPQYQLDSSNHWPQYGTFDPAILQDMNSFLQRKGKWSEVPYL
jgi:hypothetical protein